MGSWAKRADHVDRLGARLVGTGFGGECSLRRLQEREKQQTLGAEEQMSPPGLGARQPQEEL